MFPLLKAAATTVEQRFPELVLQEIETPFRLQPV